MELSVNPTAFQIKPDLDNIIHTENVKKVIQKVLSETLSDKTYSTGKAKLWTKFIADEINKSLKDSLRYKHVVQVVITQKLGQGFKFTARCRWDSECDRHTTDSFTNDTLTCIVTVFSVYLY
ncbi:CLUMA_CG008295, isoform A [Clunio marinus]|uniref:CLUMA_CG008295, isoform A n=1 Tax=Clunio marinus TaxID=568069 RepID=A0A1J1I8Q5_9DIPT|nr:CLUMA_CG008295, isoform A [Clunio marinus]